MPWSAPKRVRPVILPAQSDPGDPFVDEPGVLSGADMSGLVNPARKCKVVESAASPFKPSEDARPGRLKKLELHRSPGFALDNDRPGPNPTAADEVARPDLDDVAAAQLTINGEVKHGSVANSTVMVEPEPDGPDLLRFEGALRAEFPTCVPRLPALNAGIVL